jgi:hypothetical protein
MSESLPKHDLIRQVIRHGAPRKRHFRDQSRVGDATRPGA